MNKILVTLVMMGMAGGAYAADLSDLGVTASDLKARSEKSGIMLPTITKGYVAGNDPSAGVPVKPVEWVSISGGKFTMGTDADGFADAKPIHEVAIKTFQMSKTLVTVEQYAECVSKGKCTEPGKGDYCNWGETGRQNHPVNCVNWDQANQYAGFKGGRLPSESEWEYAATSGGKNQKYPWGNADATSELAVMDNYGTMPVCSKPVGNTAQGLCDMAGNVWQWVQDKYQNSYNGAPADGGAFEAAGSLRVIRGGSFYNVTARNLRADFRNQTGPGSSSDILGFRIAK